MVAMRQYRNVYGQEEQRTFAESPFNPVDSPCVRHALRTSTTRRAPAWTRSSPDARRCCTTCVALADWRRAHARSSWLEDAKDTRAFLHVLIGKPAHAAACALAFYANERSDAVEKQFSRRRRSSSPGALPPRRRARLTRDGPAGCCRARRVRLPGSRDRRQLRGLEGGLQPLLQGGHPLPARGGGLPLGRGVGAWSGPLVRRRSFQGRQPRRVRGARSRRGRLRAARAASTTTTGPRFWTIRRPASTTGASQRCCTRRFPSPRRSA